MLEPEKGKNQEIREPEWRARTRKREKSRKWGIRVERWNLKKGKIKKVGNQSGQLEPENGKRNQRGVPSRGGR
ncbi:hypothetical protein LQ50_09150 [Halalkalibacter okhensis]|uniref:Uncharacterized protein n=1 Tax=Halalkalibacter okhensis TaxID=333138 RepID=A0A0B0IGM4_9BACI|nr:hypothetical protein LQ50_09150 [Halalkalibacter okhensis]